MGSVRLSRHRIQKSCSWVHDSLIPTLPHYTRSSLTKQKLDFIFFPTVRKLEEAGVALSRG